MKKVAVLGSGQVGDVLSNGFLAHGYAVMRATREPQKLQAWKDNAKGEAAIGTYEEAAKWADLVVLSVKGLVAEDLVGQLAPHLAGKTVIDTTNPIGGEPPDHGVIRYFTNANESLMERLQKKVPQANFVKAFNSVGNHFMVNPKFETPATMFFCGDNAAAKKRSLGDPHQVWLGPPRHGRRGRRAPARVAVHPLVHSRVLAQRLVARAQARAPARLVSTLLRQLTANCLL